MYVMPTSNEILGTVAGALVGPGVRCPSSCYKQLAKGLFPNGLVFTHTR